MFLPPLHYTGTASSQASRDQESQSGDDIALEIDPLWYDFFPDTEAEPSSTLYAEFSATKCFCSTTHYYTGTASKLLPLTSQPAPGQEMSYEELKYTAYLDRSDEESSKKDYVKWSKTSILGMHHYMTIDDTPAAWRAYYRHRNYLKSWNFPSDRASVQYEDEDEIDPTYYKHPQSTPHHYLDIRLGPGEDLFDIAPVEEDGHRDDAPEEHDIIAEASYLATNFDFPILELLPADSL
ncbi:uncharacterized protein LY89DRAFT_690095, partial [Mollisia scopiformis]